MSITSAISRFAAGSVVGWLILFTFMLAHDHASFSDGIWLVAMWFPITCLYCAVIVAVSKRLLPRESPSLLLLLGVVVALFPLISGFWPTYWVALRFLHLFIGIQVTAIAVVASLWLIIVRSFIREV